MRHKPKMQTVWYLNLTAFFKSVTISLGDLMAAHLAY